MTSTRGVGGSCGGAMTDAEDSDVEMSVRRSMRRKRDRSEWTEVVEMSVRKSRSKGNNSKIAVSTLGGQPDHNKVQPPRLQPFCGSCGLKHAAQSNFCVSCGTKRQALKDVSYCNQKPQQKK